MPEGEIPEENHLLAQGYNAITDLLARGLDIRLRQTVRAIRLVGSGVVVATQSEAFFADRVVVTLPLGVLKRGEVVFDPPLPAAHQGAIARIGNGLLNKIVLAFPRAFWPVEAHYLRSLSDEPDSAAPEIVSLQPHLNVPVLVALVGGSVASFVFSPALTVGVGASGAIFGLMGGFVVVAVKQRLDLRPFLVLIAINLAIGFLPGTNIDWRAHLGGLVVGAAVTAAMVFPPKRLRVPVLTGTVVGVLVILGVLFAARVDQLQTAFGLR